MAVAVPPTDRIAGEQRTVPGECFTVGVGWAAPGSLERDHRHGPLDP